MQRELAEVRERVGGKERGGARQGGEEPMISAAKAGRAAANLQSELAEVRQRACGVWMSHNEQDPTPLVATLPIALLRSPPLI